MGKKKSLGEIADAIQEEQTTAPVRPSLADVADGITDGATAAPEVPAGSDPFAQPPAQGAFSPDPGSRTGSASRAVEWPKELDAPTPAPQQPIPQGKLTPDAKYGIPEDTADPAMGIRQGEVPTNERMTDLMASPQAREAMKDYKAYATTYGDLDLPGVERARGTLAKTKERLTGLVESFRTDTENLDSQTDSLIALRKQAEDAVAQERPEANQLLADFNQRRDRYNAMSEALQKKADALYDLDEVVRRNERHLARREYDIKADTGGPLGAFYNSTLRGAGKVRAGIRGYAIDAIIAMAPESSLNGMSKNDAAKWFKKLMLPVDRELFVKEFGADSTTPEYIDAVHEKNFVGSALLSVAETIPALASPYGIGLFLQSSDQAAQEMEAPEFDGVPEWKKRLFATAYGATIGRLEHVGLKNVASRTPLVKQMFARAIKEVPADATAETIKRTLADRVVDMAKAYSKDVALGSVSEFETGALQSMTENALKEAFNEAEGKKLFKHAEGWTGYIEDALVEGAAEAIGGAFFAQPFAVQSAMNSKGLGATATNEQYENLEKMFTDDLYRGSFEAMVKQQVDASKISQAKANEVVEAWKEASSIAAKVPGGLSTEKRREAFDLLREKAQLSKQDKAMVGDKITVINEKLAALAGVPAPNQRENAKPEKGSNSDRDVKQTAGASEAGDQRSATAVPGLDTEGGDGANDGGGTPSAVQGVLPDTGNGGVQGEVPAADPVSEAGVPAETPGEGDGIEKPYLTKDGKHRVTYDPETQQAEVEPLAPKPHISQWEHLSPANARREKRKAMQAYSKAKSLARKEFAKATGEKVAPASNTLKEAGQDNKAITKQAYNYSSPELGVYGTALRYFATGGKMSAAKGKTRAHMGWGDGSEITSQEKIAGWLLDDNAPSIEGVAHSIWENWHETDVDSRPDTSEILDAVIDAARTYDNATNALKALKNSFPETDQELQDRYDRERQEAEEDGRGEDLTAAQDDVVAMPDTEPDPFLLDAGSTQEADDIFGPSKPKVETPSTNAQAEDNRADVGSRTERSGDQTVQGVQGGERRGGGREASSEATDSGRSEVGRQPPRANRQDPEAERLRGEVARARQARSNFIADFNDRGSALFDEQEGNLQTSIDGGFDNSQENYNERLAEYDAAVTAAERALADHEKASRPDPNQTSLEDAAEGPKEPAKKASFARTEDQKEEVRKRMAERLKRLGKGGNLTSGGINPRDMEELVGLVGDVVELGYHKLKDVIEQIKAMVDDRLFPHITEAYRAFRDNFEHDAEVRYSLETDAEIEAEAGSGGQRQGYVRGRERVRPSGQPAGARPAIRIANQEALPVPERQYVVDGDYPIDEHQRLGVNLALNYFRKPGNEGRAFLLADGAGVGKTREILATADMVRKDTGKPVMIISLRGALDDSFKKDAKAMGIDLSNFETGTYDDLNAGKVGKGDYALVIYDESHNLKNPLSGRSTASKRVKTANTMFTSATPFDKSEFAIRFMSDITGKTNEEVESELGVEIEIVEDRYGNIRPMARYPYGFMTYLERLVAMRNQVIADGGMIRREYPFYGTVQEMDAGAMPAELQSEVAKVEEIASKREEAAENLVKAKWASERARVMGTNFNKEWKWVDDGVRSGKLQEEYGRRYRDFIRDERRQSLDAIDKLTEPHKVDVAIKEAKKAIANGEQVIMVVEGVGDRTAKMGSEKSKYGYFERKVTPATESLKKAMDAAGIRYALIAGGNRSGSYQREQDRFNKGEAQVLIMTAKSGGTGINLDDTVGDAPRRMIMLTPPYGGDTFEQAIGRVSRRNTASPSTVQTMRFQGNRSDDNRAEKVAMKRSVIDAVVIGDDLDMRRLEQNAPPEALAQRNLRGNIKDPGLKGSVEAVAKALSAIAPNVKIIAHADPLKFFSEAYLAGATGDGNSSVTAFYNASANEIHINAQDAKSTTLFHEAAHPVLAAAIQNNPELVNSLYNELAGRPDFAKYKKFGQQYEGENLQKVEALVEFMADVAAGNVTQAANPNSLWQKVKAWLNDVLSKIGFGPKDIKLDPSSLRAFADGFAKAMRDGIRINGDKLRADMTVAEQRRAAEFTPDEIAGNIKAKGLSKAEAEAFMKQKGMSQSKIDAVLKAYDGAQQGQFAFINPPMPPGEVQDAFEKQEAEAKKHRLSFGKRLYRSYIQKFEDKKGVAKDLLSQAGAAEAVIRLNLVSGAGGAAKAKFTKYHAQVHGDLNTTEKSVLNNIIQARRIINLDEKYDGITAPKKQHPYGMTGESVQKWLDDLAAKHPELHSKLMGRADAYFKAMGEMLEMKHKEGIISDELYDKLKNDEYSPREFVHHLVDAEERMVIGTTDVSRTGIKRLLDGSNEALFNNSEWLLANQVASTHKLVFNNRANKALYKWAVTEGDPEIAYPLQEGEEPRSGFQAISHFAGGQMVKVAVRNEIATPWLQSDSALRPDLANAIRVVTGGSLFRVMVTGANLTFALRNFPRDVGHVLMFTNTYSNMLPRALAEMGLDLAKVSGDAFKRKGRYQEYMEEGGSMDFLTRQGRPLTSKESIFSKDGLLRRKTAAEKGLDGFMHFAGYINETSEIVVRLAVREREISKLTDAFVFEKKRKPDASELKWIKEQATAKAREYMDFNQGGEWAKAVDSAIPYLNAGFQGTRVMARYIKTNPKVFAWKMAQLSALTAMIMAHNLGHEDEWEEIPDEIKENNFVILIPRWTRTDKDGRKRTRYFTIPKTHDQRIFSSFTESIMEYVVLGKYPTKRSMIALKQATPFDPKRIMDVPLINAMYSYADGYDTYRDRNVFPRKDNVEDWAEYTQRTPGIYKDVARWTSTIDENGKMVGGLSPERSKLFVEKYAGLSENNLFFMLTNKAWEMGRGAFSGQGEEFDKSMIEHLNDVAMPFYGSFIRETNPRSADEAFERHSRLEATRRHVESVAVKELVGKYNAASTEEQKNAVKKEAVDQINSFASEDRKRAIENFKNGILLKDVPYMYVAMKTEPMAVRVNSFAEVYRGATDREKEKMLEYANRAKLFTPKFLEELKKKMAELDTMEKKGAEK